MSEEDLALKIARLEERLNASDRATKIAQEALTHYQTVSNEWRQALNDQRAQFVTLDKVFAIVGLAMAILTIIFKYLK